MTTGILSTAKKLDYDTIHQYNFTIEVKDHGTPRRSVMGLVSPFNHYLLLVFQNVNFLNILQRENQRRTGQSDIRASPGPLNNIFYMIISILRFSSVFRSKIQNIKVRPWKELVVYFTVIKRLIFFNKKCLSSIHPSYYQATNCIRILSYKLTIHINPIPPQGKSLKYMEGLTLKILLQSIALFLLGTLESYFLIESFSRFYA